MHRLLLLSVLTVLLNACGQIGPLYLPENEPDPKPPAAAAPEYIEQAAPIETSADTPAAVEAK